MLSVWFFWGVQILTFLGRIYFTVALLSVGVIPPAFAASASEYSEQTQEWREGYVFGIMEFLAGVADSDDKKAVKSADRYRRCFQENKINSTEGARIIGRYLLRTPDASAEPMISNVIQAFIQTCNRYFAE